MIFRHYDNRPDPWLLWPIHILGALLCAVIISAIYCAIVPASSVAVAGLIAVSGVTFVLVLMGLHYDSR